jgi:hypothetical protein
MTIFAMSALNKLSLVELEELAAKLRHAIARNPEDARTETSATLSVSQPRGVRPPNGLLRLLSTLANNKHTYEKLEWPN